MFKKFILFLLLQLTAYTASAVMVVHQEGDGVLDLNTPIPDSDQVVVLAAPGEQLSTGNPINFALNNNIQGSNVLATFTLNRISSFQNFSLTITNGPETINILQSDFTINGLLGTYELVLNGLSTGAFTANMGGAITGNDFANFTWVVNTPAIVPIPAAAWLFGSALVGMATVGRRRKKA